MLCDDMDPSCAEKQNRKAKREGKGKKRKKKEETAISISVSGYILVKGEERKALKRVFEGGWI
jgi:hypothetical protein